MVADPVNVVLCFLGILFWPQLTLCIILWSLGHPVLGVIALLSSWGSVTKIIKERYIDHKTGEVVKEVVREE
jgi:hypothetical protein